MQETRGCKGTTKGNVKKYNKDKNFLKPQINEVEVEVKEELTVLTSQKNGNRAPAKKNLDCAAKVRTFLQRDGSDSKSQSDT